MTDTETGWLTKQLHPHFFLNIMNCLYAMTLDESVGNSKGMARISEVISKISELLRSMLYECNVSEIPLKKEVGMIRDFLDLQAMRFDKGIDVDFVIKGTLTGKNIAPLLFLTLVENCFKHQGPDLAGNSYVRIKIKTDQRGICFVSENSSGVCLFPAKPGSTGLGLKNLKERLHHFYPGKFDLKIDDREESFRVVLNIKVPHSVPVKSAGNM